ncbi:Six-hairpin glycosidase [Penicillium vulpinum]|uniref:Six-hairpin glycosidase n=1 Tax=Penicillium vulpinum TaxID=29845 RepID=UPI00254979BB|nr:Six-hairpin glycosidase [Penicillium vulpinum]KAJ5971535.1 Six-hairpin glycosidase [Penicillium vulpinum]
MPGMKVESIKNAAAIAAFNTMSTYTSNMTGRIPGKLDGTWGEGGALFQTMIEYWHFTGDASNNKATYSDWAEKIWSASVPILNTTNWRIVDGLKADCKSHQDMQWTHNYHISINGEISKWNSGIDGLLNTSFKLFFPQSYGGKIMTETSCEITKTCNRYQ